MPKNYILRNVDERLWERLKVVAALHGLSVKQAIINAITNFVNALEVR